MNTNTNKAIGFLAIIGLVLVVAFLISVNAAKTASASVRTGDEYLATTTNAASANTRTLKAGRGALGQVTITGAAAGTMTFYDATTSNSTLRTGQLATSSLAVIADFPASAAAGTYMFDAGFSNGLLLVTTGVAATSSVMTK